MRFLKMTSIAVLAAVLLSACSTKTTDSAQGHGHHGSPNVSEQKDIAVETSWKLSDEKPQPNKETNLDIQINSKQGKPIEAFDISHEKKLHLIVVSKDLTYFNHIHPEFKGQGKFEIATQFPAGGEYKLIADFIPTGGKQLTETKWVKVEGNSKQNPITPDTELTKVVEGKEVTLAFNQLKAGKELQMTFTIHDAQSKKPITNLQPYLGAVGHVVILSADAEQYIHNHPIDELAKGPEATFATQFPQKGIYKIWGQFQHEDKVFTVPFVVQVP